VDPKNGNPVWKRFTNCRISVYFGFSLFVLPLRKMADGGCRFTCVLVSGGAADMDNFIPLLEQIKFALEKAACTCLMNPM
jgi:hypothetical protein